MYSPRPENVDASVDGEDVDLSGPVTVSPETPLEIVPVSSLVAWPSLAETLPSIQRRLAPLTCGKRVKAARRDLAEFLPPDDRRRCRKLMGEPCFFFVLLVVVAPVVCATRATLDGSCRVHVSATASNCGLSFRRKTSHLWASSSRSTIPELRSRLPSSAVRERIQSSGP